MINLQEDTRVPGLPNFGNHKVSSLFLANFDSEIACYNKLCASRLFWLWFYSFASGFHFFIWKWLALMKILFVLPFNYFASTVGKLIFNHVIEVCKNLL